ncbi:UNVERIFIED_ORG: hypothetical protein ABIC62_003696 [Burkholderia sp. 1595]|uniref:Uncharacterized protein n=1 Tax=Paraburkholderia terricola TaxID=169427 RepID=A0ABU1LVY9_9BURK|nr:hypothetical protein [Paraburkholderia terricola]
MSPVCTPAAKRSRQEKAAQTASFEVGLLAWRGQWCIWNRCPRPFGARDKAVILPALHCVLAGRVRRHTSGFAWARCWPSASPRRGAENRRLFRTCRWFLGAGCGSALTVRPLAPTRSAHAALPVAERLLTAKLPAVRRTTADRRSCLRFEERLLTEEAACGLMKYRDGARSAAGRMTAVSQGRSARGHRFQMHHDPLQARRPTSRLAV